MTDGIDRLIKLSRVVYDETNPPKPGAQRQWPPGINAEACHMLFGGLARLKERVMGDKYHICKQSRVACVIAALRG